MQKLMELSGKVVTHAQLEAEYKRRGKNNRRRGQDGERELITMIRDDFGIAHKGRNLGQERDGGDDIALGPWDVQVKRRKRLAGLYEWLETAHLAAVRADGKGWLVVMPWPLFVKLAREEIAGDK
jgi:hypothetical protein